VTQPILKQKNSTATELLGPANLRDPAVIISLSIGALFGVYLLLTSTTNIAPGIWPYDAKRMLEFFLLLLLALAPVANTRIRFEFSNLLAAVPTFIQITLLATFFWGVISVLSNTRSLMQGLNSFSEVALLFSLAPAVIVVAACRRIAGRSFDRLAIGLVALTGLTVGMQELIGVLAAHNAGLDFNFRISLLHFSWPRFYNQVQSWMIPPLLAIPVLFARFRLAHFLCVLVLGLQWYIILATGGRGSFVSIGTAIVFALVFLPAIRSRLIAWQLLGIALGALIFILVMFSFEKRNAPVEIANTIVSSQSTAITETGRNSNAGQSPSGENSFFKQSLGKPMASTSGRIEMWRITVEDIQQHPLLGIGPMNYVCVSQKRIGHPHNFLLQLASEWGIVVAIAVFLTVLYLLWRSILGIRNDVFDSKEDRTLAGLLFTGILAAALHACLSGIMVMPASQVTGILVSGMLVGLYPAARQQQTHRATGLVLAAGIMFSIYLLAIGSYELVTMKKRAELLVPGQDMWPRMWQDAKVCTLYSEQIEVKN